MKLFLKKIYLRERIGRGEKGEKSPADSLLSAEPDVELDPTSGSLLGGESASPSFSPSACSCSLSNK